MIRLDRLFERYISVMIAPRVNQVDSLSFDQSSSTLPISRPNSAGEKILISSIGMILENPSDERSAQADQMNNLPS